MIVGETCELIVESIEKMQRLPVDTDSRSGHETSPPNLPCHPVPKKRKKWRVLLTRKAVKQILPNGDRGELEKTARFEVRHYQMATEVNWKKLPGLRTRAVMLYRPSALGGKLWPF
jgi:hypothetical protein